MDYQRSSFNIVTLLLNEIKHLQHRNTLLRGTMATIQSLMSTPDLNTSLCQTLKEIGLLLEADRVYLFKNNDSSETESTLLNPFLYWVRGGGRVTLYHLPWRDFADFLKSDWYSTLAIQKPLYINATEYSAQDRLRFNTAGVCSMLLLPIFINELFWGYISLETLHRVKQWDANEESLLASIAKTIGTTLNHQHREEQLELSAFYDDLTHLPNRALFINRLEQLSLQTVRDSDTQFAVVLLDFDRFKALNDHLGHAIADQFLIKIADQLAANVRPGDTVARLGEDKFVVLLNPIQSQNDVLFIAERLRNALNQVFFINEYPVQAETNIGIVLSRQGDVNAAQLLQQADRARYFARIAGKGNYRIFDCVMEEEMIVLSRLEPEMRPALKHQDFEVYYQPIFHLPTERLQGFEALLRWNHTQHGLIFPDVFIALAEDTGIIDQLDQFVMEQSCAQLRRWHDSYPEQYPLTLNFNVAIQELRQPDFTKHLTHLLKREHLKPHHVRIELTESKVFEEDQQVLTTLHQLLDMGIQLQLDSFGVGYSSLSSLHQLPFRALKIDRSFIERIDTGEQGQGMVRAIVETAHTLNIDVIAEGIETLSQLNFLKSLHCAYGQGYWYSPPLNSWQAELFLREYAMSYNQSTEKFPTLPLNVATE